MRRDYDPNIGRYVESDLIAHRGAHRAHEYEIVYDRAGCDGRPSVPGLIDVQALKHAYDCVVVLGATAGVVPAEDASIDPLIPQTDYRNR